MNLTKLHKQAIVRAIMQDTPPLDRAKWAKEINAAIVEAMSPEVRKVYKTKPHALRAVSVPYANEFSRWSCSTPVGDVTEKQISEIVAPYEKQSKERHDMECKLHAAFEGIRTLKQAEATFPEFKKYYPTEAQPTKNLPALANVVADLSKLGWPRNNKSTKGATK